MGANDSKIKVCRYCATEIIPPSFNANNTNQNDFYSSSGDEKLDKLDKLDKSSNPSDSTSSINIELPSNTLLCYRCHGFYKLKTENNNNTTNTNKRYIEQLHIAPFIETLKNHMNEEKEIDSDYIINKYLKPYFIENTNLIIKYKSRVIIKEIEFKVLGCYPPIGYINTNTTKFHLNDSNGKLIKLSYKPIKQIYISPINSSLSTFNKLNNINNNNKLNNTQLTNISIKPYLFNNKSNDKVYYITNDNRFYLSDKTLFGTDTDTNNDTNKEAEIDYKLLRHITEEETFISKGILWRVMKCIPWNGYINKDTKLEIGTEINDANKISIRPIYDSLPHSHRNFTPKQIRKYYLDPFFCGRYRYINNKKEFKIFGVDFAVRDCDPIDGGIITQLTMIDSMGAPIKLKQLYNIQEMEDQELAEKLAKEMEEENVKKLRRMRLNRTLRGQQWNDPLGFEMGFDFPWNRQQQIIMKKKNNGVNKEIIERLPTFIYCINNNTNNNGECSDNQCRICLEYYIEGDTLRILPCFHFYHSQCIDTWLVKMSSKCPICKTSIIRRQRHAT